MDSASRFATIEQRKEVSGIFEGNLTQDTLTLIQQKITEAESATTGRDENTVFSARHIYRDQAAILEYMTEPYGELRSIEEAYPKHESIVLGYCDGWDKMLSSMGSVLSILICLLIVITLSPVFAEEYTAILIE